MDDRNLASLNMMLGQFVNGYTLRSNHYLDKYVLYSTDEIISTNVIKWLENEGFKFLHCTIDKNNHLVGIFQEVKE